MLELFSLATGTPALTDGGLICAKCLMLSGGYFPKCHCYCHRCFSMDKCHLHQFHTHTLHTHTHFQPHRRAAYSSVFVRTRSIRPLYCFTVRLSLVPVFDCHNTGHVSRSRFDSHKAVHCLTVVTCCHAVCPSISSLPVTRQGVRVRVCLFVQVCSLFVRARQWRRW